MIRSFLYVLLILLCHTGLSQTRYNSIVMIGGKQPLRFECDGKPCQGAAFNNVDSGNVAYIGSFEDGLGIGEIQRFEKGKLGEVMVFDKDGYLFESKQYDGCLRLTQHFRWKENVSVRYAYNPLTGEPEEKRVGQCRVVGAEKVKYYVWKKSKWVRSS